MSDVNHHRTACGVSDGKGTCLHHKPKHFQMRALDLSAHTLARFHIPPLHNHVVSRSEVSINDGALRSEAASRVRGRRHLPGAQEVAVIDAVQECLSSGKAWIF